MRCDAEYGATKPPPPWWLVWTLIPVLVLTLLLLGFLLVRGSAETPTADDTPVEVQP